MVPGFDTRTSAIPPNLRNLPTFNIYLENTMINHPSTLLKLTTLLILITLLVACGSKINESNYQKIQEGMTMEQVQTILGEPTKTASVGVGSLSGTTANWIYDKLTISIQFLNNKVQLKSLSGGK